MNAPVHDPLAPYRIEREPYYRNVGDETMLFNAAFDQIGRAHV